MSRGRRALFALLPLLLVLSLTELLARGFHRPPCSHIDDLLRYAHQLPPQSIEASMRASVPMPDDPVLGWINLPNYQGMNLGAQVRHNALGLRGPDRPLHKPAGLHRVVVLGDSSIYGHGVAEQDTFVQLLESALKNRVPQGALEVINAGVPAYSSLQSLRQLSTLIAPMQPDIVIIANLWSDSMPTEHEDATWLVGTGLMAGLHRARQGIEDGLSAHSAAWCTIKDLSSPTLNDSRFRAISQPSAIPRSELPTRRVPPAAYQANLEAMAQWAYTHQAIPLILTLGNPHDTPAGLVGISEAHQANILAYRAAQAQAATQSHALYTDMTPIFAAEQSAGNDKLFLDSVHPSPIGHLLIAQALFQTLLSDKNVRQVLTVP